MLVNIRLEGTDLHWIITQESVRIGRGADCDIPLPAEKFPMVSREHVVLRVENGQVRFTDSNSANGSYVNGNRTSGTRLVTGDILQLGHNGPRLVIEINAEAEKSVSSAATMVTPVGAPPVSPASVAPTMIGFGPGGPAGAAPVRAQETSVEDLGPLMGEDPDATADIPQYEEPKYDPGNAATIVRPAMAEAATVVRPIPSQSAPTVIGQAPWQQPDAVPTVVVPGFEAPPGFGAVEEEPAVEEATQEQAEQAAAVEEVETPTEPEVAEEPTSSEQSAEPKTYATETGLSPEEEAMIERKIDTMKNLVMALAALVVVLLCLAFYQNQQIDKNIKAVDDLKRQAQGAVASFTPQLDQRLNALDKRLDSVDDRMKQAEDRMVSRINSEIPVMLDKYVNKKMDELNRQAATMQPR